MYLVPASYIPPPPPPPPPTRTLLGGQVAAADRCRGGEVPNSSTGLSPLHPLTGLTANNGVGGGGGRQWNQAEGGVGRSQAES